MKHDWFAQSGAGLISSLWLANAMKVALMKPSYVPNRDTQLVWTDISASEIAITAPYVAGGQLLANKAKNYDAANDRMNLLADDSVWGPAFTTDVAFAVVYDSSGTKPIWSLVDFEGTKSVINGTLTIDWAAIGLLYIAAI